MACKADMKRGQTANQTTYEIRITRKAHIKRGQTLEAGRLAKQTKL